MPTFKGSDFEIELPKGSTDESTYAFAFPARSNFRPSVVVKTERLSQTVDPREYIQTQLDQIKKTLPDVLVTGPPTPVHGALMSYWNTYDWGEDNQRVRQKQLYIFLEAPLRVVTLTATNLLDDFNHTEQLFDAVFRSFRPFKRDAT